VVLAEGCSSAVISECLRLLILISVVPVSRDMIRTCVRSGRPSWSPHRPGRRSAPGHGSAPPTRKCSYRSASTWAAWPEGTWPLGAGWGESRTNGGIASGRSPQCAAAAGPAPSPAPPTTSGPGPTTTCRPSARACGGPSPAGATSPGAGGQQGRPGTRVCDPWGEVGQAAAPADPLGPAGAGRGAAGGGPGERGPGRPPSPAAATPA
jgi:hypothetical protein